MKKTYVTPEMEIQWLEERDIITSSDLPQLRKGEFSLNNKKETSLDSDWDRGNSN